MAWYEETPITSFKKEYEHNLGFEPIVFGYVDISTLDSTLTGWKLIPFKYVYLDGTTWYSGTVDYYHKDVNTVVFTAPEDASIVADIFIDPQEEAWYE